MKEDVFAYIEPSGLLNDSYSDISFSSSNTQVASADNGTITALSAGTTTTTATLGTLKSETELTVLDPVTSKVGTASSFPTISSNTQPAFAIKPNGDLWTWTDSNASKMLSNTSKYVGDYLYDQEGNGLFVNYAINKSGNLWSWGYNGLTTDNTPKKQPVTNVTGIYGSIAYHNDSTTSSYSYTSSSLESGTRYYYKVKSYKKSGSTIYESSASAAVSAVPVQATPSNLKSTRVSSTSIRLTWSASADTSGYEIYRSSSLNGSYTRVAAVTGKSYQNSGLKSRTRYFYKIRSYKTVGKTKYSSSFTSVVSA